MSRPRPRGRILAAVGAAVTTAVLVASSGGAPASATGRHHHHKPKAVKLQILALNDFHGQLDTVADLAPSGGSTPRPAGGAAYLATHLASSCARRPGPKRHRSTVAAGDLIGASPLLSAAFHDEPTIEAMNKMGLQVTSVGNHEFDEGWRELLPDAERRLPRRRRRQGQPELLPRRHTFTGADFQYLVGQRVQTDDRHRRSSRLSRVKKYGTA